MKLLSTKRRRARFRCFRPAARCHWPRGFSGHLRRAKRNPVPACRCFFAAVATTRRLWIATTVVESRTPRLDPGAALAPCPWGDQRPGPWAQRASLRAGTKLLRTGGTGKKPERLGVPQASEASACPSAASASATISSNPDGSVASAAASSVQLPLARPRSKRGERRCTRRAGARRSRASITATSTSSRCTPTHLGVNGGLCCGLARVRRGGSMIVRADSLDRK
jgi:hypothetical protein